MRWTSILRRWTVRSLHSMILGAAVCGPASMVAAQTSTAAASKPANLHFSKSTSFDASGKAAARRDAAAFVKQFVKEVRGK